MKTTKVKYRKSTLIFCPDFLVSESSGSNDITAASKATIDGSPNFRPMSHTSAIGEYQSILLYARSHFIRYRTAIQNTTIQVTESSHPPSCCSARTRLGLALRRKWDKLPAPCIRTSCTAYYLTKLFNDIHPTYESREYSGLISYLIDHKSNQLKRSLDNDCMFTISSGLELHSHLYILSVNAWCSSKLSRILFSSAD